MIQVKNRACVRTIAVRSLRASKMRNLIAVIAITTFSVDIVSIAK